MSQAKTTRDATINPGTYLLHASGDTRLTDISVVEYELDVEPGVNPSENVDRFTASAAYYFDQQHGTPVAESGDLQVVSLTELSRSINTWGKSVAPQNGTRIKLDPADDADNYRLKQLVYSALRRAIPRDKYSFRFLNEIVRTEPSIKADSGKFAAYPKYDLSVEVTADGVPLLHVESGHTLSTLKTLNQQYDPSDELPQLKVEHDTSIYDEPGSGIVLGWSKKRYTDRLETVGNSTASLHKGKLDDQHRKELMKENPRLVKIKYGEKERHQLPHVLRPIPSLDQIKNEDRSFHQDYTSKRGLLPHRRYQLAHEFVRDLTLLPGLEVDFQLGPTNYGYEFVPIRKRTSRLIFNDGLRDDSPKKGLRRYGVRQSPGKYRVGVLFPDRFTELKQDFEPLLVRRLRDIEAPGHTTGYTYTLGDTADYTQVAQSIDDAVDVVVAIVPDKEAFKQPLFSDIDDPFDELKRALMRRGMPTQMMRKPTVERLVDTNASVGNDIFLNTLSAIVAKAGGTPWEIVDLPGQTDAFLGLDVTEDQDTGQHAGASASVVFANGTVFAAESTPLQSGETFEPGHVEQFIRDLVYENNGHNGNENDQSISHITVVRDGKIHEEIETIREGLKGIDVTFDVVGIRKSGQSRVVKYEGNRFKIADKGVAFVDSDRNRSVLHPWGMPETTQDNSQGTPRTIGVIKDSGPTPLETLTRQMYWLTEMHFGSPARSTREPVPIRYADDAAEYVRRGYVSAGEVINGPAYL